MNAMSSDMPVAVIGAGPVGLAAAARLVERGIRPAVFEKGSRVGSTLLDWGHVRVFSPWDYNVDAAARSLLDEEGVAAPLGEYLPTGEEIVNQYLEPLSRVPAIDSGLHLGAEVTGITRLGHDLMSNDGRADAPFVIRFRDGDGEHRMLARAVIDASGTWSRPNPIGADGLPASGEDEGRELISYGIPDVGGAARASYAGKRTLVLGSGHSAINVALDLLDLQRDEPGTQVVWALRRDRIARLLGGGLNDQLPGRGALGMAAKQAIDEGRLDMRAPFAVDRIKRAADRLRVEATHGGRPVTEQVDRIVVATGFRPDFSFLRELRLGLDPAVEAPPALAPLIDPNFHSCGTVPPHGVDELVHPEPGFFIVGSKSYGRAPTFLMTTGYEQVRSVVAELAGDTVAARQVQLVLPETGVCGAPPSIASASSCCSPSNEPAVKSAPERSVKAATSEGTGWFISALGAAQVCSWGTLFYGFPLIAEAMRGDLGWSKPTLYGAATAGMLLAGAAAYPVGAAIDRGHGRLLMSGASVLAGLLLAAWSRVESLVAFYLVLAVLGCMQAATLYEPAFAVIARRVGPLNARRGITALTLWGGFASTVFIPVIQFVIEAYGWRGALLVMAAVNVVVCGGLYYLAVDPSKDAPLRTVGPDTPPPAAGRAAVAAAMRKPAYWGLMASWISYAFAFSSLTYHFFPLLLERGLDSAGAVAVLTVIGPAQVAGRILVRAFASEAPVSTLGSVIVIVFPLAVVGFAFAPPEVIVIASVAAFYGAANGMITIVRGMAVPEMVSRDGYGAVNGSLVGPMNMMSALAPLGAALLWQAGDGYGWVLVAIFAGSLTLCLGFWFATWKT